MKKIYSLLLTLAAAGALSASAQQLPNPGFETWSTSESTPWTNGNGSKTIGYNPSNWCISHVMGVSTGILAGTGKKAMGEQVNPGYNRSIAAAKIFNEQTGALGINRNVPGYITLGTTWSTAEGSKTATHDGGTWGGISFGYRPDAIEFMYKREYADANATTEPFSFIAYLWKGSWSQASVPVTITSGGAIADNLKCTMINRDRNVLSLSPTTTGGSVTPSADAELIGKIIITQSGAKTDWTHAQFEMEYLTSSDPTMFNIIFSANDYFNAESTPVIGNSLTIDDVKLIYYSRLASLTINGTSVAGFSSDTYNYTVDSEMPDESAFAFTCMGNSGSGKATLKLDKENAVATITVTNNNAGGTDTDGEAAHIYTIHFNKTASPSEKHEGTRYDGTLTISINDINLNVSQQDSVFIKDNGDGTCTFLLPDFTLTLDESNDPSNFGDIKVDNVKMTKNADGMISYSGEVKGLQLANGEINADVTISGTETADGKITMNIPVLWTDAEMTIDVEFNGEKTSTEPVTPVYEGTKYDGTLTIEIETINLNVSQPDNVYIKDNGDGTCTFLLPNFTLTLDEDNGPSNFGDIKVDNVKMTRNADGTISYSGEVKGLQLANGEINADVTISGTETASGALTMIIPVIWTDADMTIDVTFNGQANTVAGITDVPVDNTNAPVEYYDLKGNHIGVDNLTPGIYIRRQGTDVTKILVK